MKRRVCILMMFVMIFTFVGCSKKADPISLPSASEISSISIETMKDDIVTYSTKEEIESFLTVLLSAIPTKKQSVNDTPNAKRYGKINIQYNDGVTTIFFYTKGKKNYIEQPYQGVYVLKEAGIEEIIEGQ